MNDFLYVIAFIAEEPHDIVGYLGMDGLNVDIIEDPDIKVFLTLAEAEEVLTNQPWQQAIKVHQEFLDVVARL